jgi:hypothetical protein
MNLRKNLRLLESVKRLEVRTILTNNLKDINMETSIILLMLISIMVVYVISQIKL